MLYQQGDVLMKKMDCLPWPCLLKKTTDPVLAKGEATGHVHTIAPDDLSNVDIYTDENGNIFVEAKKPATIVHQEHKPVTIPEGVYQVSIVREYDHFANEAKGIRFVRD